MTTYLIIVLQSVINVRLFVTPWTAACQASLSSLSLLRVMSIELMMLSNCLILCCLLLLLPSIFSSIRVFSSETAVHIWWPKYWSFSVSISPSNEYSRLISFSIDWFDFLVDQRTLKSTVWKYQFLGTQPSCCNSYILTGLLEEP